MRHHEITTIRRILYNVPGNLVEKGRYRHIRYPNNPLFKTVITYIRKALMVNIPNDRNRHIKYTVSFAIH